MLSFLFVLVATVVVVWLFYRLYVPFGGRTPARQLRASANFQRDKFVNLTPVDMRLSLRQQWSLFRDYMRTDPGRRPPRLLVPDLLNLQTASSKRPRITWFGHSAFLLEIAGKQVLLDPMFGTSPSPFPAIGPQRFSTQLPALPDDLPAIDAVVISHDHYDHLDYPSIKRLAPKVRMFFVPLGLGAHLRRWGVGADRITELDWWQEGRLDDIRFVCTPSRHFSGRTLTDRFATLWASWVVEASDAKVFFSGDGGYGPHFADIGKKYGPFDLTLMECGQYDDRWADIHMTPEQTIQAHQDLHGKYMIPMHWGAFVLALHGWSEPVERVLIASRQHGARVLTPRIGQTLTLGGRTPHTEPWWKEL
jgi:L-ascorbate metabolism protein UlaG (beta-lactamase superfamily)